jgi:hypothetical protein
MEREETGPCPLLRSWWIAWSFLGKEKKNQRVARGLHTHTLLSFPSLSLGRAVASLLLLFSTRESTDRLGRPPFFLSFPPSFPVAYKLTLEYFWFHVHIIRVAKRLAFHFSPRSPVPSVRPSALGVFDCVVCVCVCEGGGGFSCITLGRRRIDVRTKYNTENIHRIIIFLLFYHQVVARWPPNMTILVCVCVCVCNLTVILQG